VKTDLTIFSRIDSMARLFKAFFNISSNFGVVLDYQQLHLTPLSFVWEAE
jgi:hypothetical protein